MKTRTLILSMIVVFCLFFALGWYTERYNRMEAPNKNPAERRVETEKDNTGTGGDMFLTAGEGPQPSAFEQWDNQTYRAPENE